MTYWGVVDPALANDIYICENFQMVFEKYSGREKDRIFPTIAVRKLMWELRMKPLQKEFWENDI